MDGKNLGLALLVMIFWGVGSFVGKLATNRIGEKAVFWDLLGYAPAIILYSLIVFKSKELLGGDKMGIFYGILAGLIGSGGLIGFYILLSKKEASSAVPLTALYPALTAILAFLFLKEQLTVTKGVGIVLSAIALYLLGV
jgi:transporter family protein